MPIKIKVSLGGGHQARAQAPTKRDLLASTAGTVVLGVMTIIAPSFAFAQTVTGYNTYSNTASTTANTSPTANSAGDIGGGNSIAIGINAHSSNPNGTFGTGDAIAIGSDVHASNQDAIAIGAQTYATGVNTIAIGNLVVGGGSGNPANGGAAVGTLASGANSIAFGANSTSSGFGSVTFGTGSNATANFATAIGNLSNATTVGGVALGYGSIANRGPGSLTEVYSQTVVNSPYGALSIGQAGQERQITNVAGGTQATDAVNLRQLQAVANDTAGTLGGSFNAAGAYTAPTYMFASKPYSSLTNTVAAINNLTVQYTADSSGNPTNAIDLTRGGTTPAGPVSITGVAAATTSSGAVALSQLPIQYSTASAPTTANPAIASNDVTLIGTGGQPVTLHNIAPGALNATSADAVNGAQLYATNQNQAADAANITDLRGSLNNGTIGLVQQSGAGRPITVGVGTDGTVVDFTNNAKASRTLTGVGAGSLTANSVDAVNGSQLYATNQMVSGLTAGTLGLVQQDPASRAITVGAGTDGTTVNFANNAGTARVLTNVANGQIASGGTQGVNGGQIYAVTSSVAANFGGGSTVNPDGSVSAPSYNVLGGTYDNVGAAVDSLNTGLKNINQNNNYFLGINSLPATGIVATASGQNAVALGQNTRASTTDGVALGSNSMALRGGLNGAQESFSNTAVASNEGALSIGAAGGERQITNVAGGTQATDAVNVRQLTAVNSGVASALGAGATLNPDGSLRGPTYVVGSTTYSNVGSALDGLNTDVANINKTGTAYFAVRSVGAPATATGTDAIALGPNTSSSASGGVALGADAAATRGGLNGAQELFSTQRVASNEGAVSVGAVGAERQITNVAGGTQATDAVNVRQLTSLGGGLASVLGGGAALNPDGTVYAPSYSVQGTSFSTVGGAIDRLDTTVTNINKTGTSYLAVNSVGAPASATGTDAVALGPNAVSSVATGVALGANSSATRAGLNGALESFTNIAVASNAGAVSIGSGGAERQITNVAGGTQATDAVNLRQLGAVYNAAVKYDIDPTTGVRGNSITLAGADPNTPVLIHNVATGTLASDAANVGQVQAVSRALGGGATFNQLTGAYTPPTYNVAGKKYTDVGSALGATTNYTNAAIAGVENQIGSLQTQVGAARIEARQAATIGLAAASLHFDTQPGKLSTAVGAGVWKGEAATAMGLGYALPDGSARLSASGVTTGRDFGMSAGASFTLN